MCFLFFLNFLKIGKIIKSIDADFMIHVDMLYMAQEHKTGKIYWSKVSLFYQN